MYIFKFLEYDICSLDTKRNPQSNNIYIIEHNMYAYFTPMDLLT